MAQFFSVTADIFSSCGKITLKKRENKKKSGGEGQIKRIRKQRKKGGRKKK